MQSRPVFTVKNRLKNVLILASAGGLMAAGSLIAWASPVAATKPAPKPQQIVALGDAVSSGLGAGDLIANSGSCARSTHAYPALWAAKVKPDRFVFIACNGATTSTVISQQLPAVDQYTTMITVTVGAEDFDFSEKLKLCIQAADTQCADSLAALAKEAAATLPDRVAALLDAIKQSAPQAHVIVFGYPWLYQPNGDCPGELSEIKRIAINKATDAIDEALATAANAGGDKVTWMDTRIPFTSHDLCTKTAWAHASSALEAFKPNAAGHAEGFADLMNTATKALGPNPAATAR